MKYKKNILALVDEYQYKEAITYPKTSERVYDNLRAFAVLCFLYLFLLSAMLFVSLILTAGQSEYPKIWNTGIALALHTLAFIIMFFKYNLAGLLLNITATVFKTIPLMSMLVYNGSKVEIQSVFYWQHLIPMILVLITSFCMCVISTREKYLINRDYKVVLGKLYDKYHTDEMTEEEWTKFVDNYEKKDDDNKKKKKHKKNNKKDDKNDDKKSDKKSDKKNDKKSDKKNNKKSGKKNNKK